MPVLYRGRAEMVDVLIILFHFFVYILTDTWKESVLSPHPSHPCRLLGPRLVIRGQRPLDSGERSRAPLRHEEPLAHAVCWHQALEEE